MRLLVTGAGGFVGRWLTRELAAAGHETIGPAEHDLDVRDRGSVFRALESIRPDAIAHLAAVAYAPDAAGDPGQALAVTVGGTLNLLEGLRATRQSPVVLITGSSEVYGAPLPGTLPLTENAALAPRTQYALTKVAQEAVAMRAASTMGLRLVVTRSFNHAGPGQRPVFVVPAVAQRVFDAFRELPAGGTGKVRVGNLDVRRDFTDVRDVVRAYRLLLEGLWSGSIPAGGTLVNVASGRSVSIRSILEAMIERSGAPIEPEIDRTLVRDDDPADIRGDASLLTHLTGWRPERELSATLTDVWAEVAEAAPAGR